MKYKILIIKKHFKKNFTNLVVNIIAIFLTMAALIITTNVMVIKEDFNSSILSSFPNENVFKISKNYQIDFENGYNLIQKIRPTIREIESIEYFNNIKVDIDLSYLLESYTFKIDELIKNETIIFEPHFRNDEVFYFSGFDYDNFSLSIEQEFLIENDDEKNYELFIWHTSSYAFVKVNVFKFLSLPTIYYPYYLLKNAAEITYFKSIDKNLYQYIYEKEGNSIETNYSLIANISHNDLNLFNNSEYSNLYEISNTPLEISSNFMNLFSTILDFSFYFLIVIIVLVSILFLYTIYMLIMKNHKEIALLRTYGMSKFQINMLYSSEIVFLFMIPFAFASFVSWMIFLIVDNRFMPTLNIASPLNLNIKLIFIILFVSLVFLLSVSQILLSKINKINIRKELNSL